MSYLKITLTNFSVRVLSRVEFIPQKKGLILLAE